MGVLLLVFANFAKIDEQSLNLVLWNSHSRVFYHNVKTYKAKLGYYAYVFTFILLLVRMRFLDYFWEIELLRRLHFILFAT